MKWAKRANDALIYGSGLDLRHALPCCDVATRRPQRAPIIDIGNKSPMALLLGLHRDPALPLHGFVTLIDDSDAAFSR